MMRPSKLSSDVMNLPCILPIQHCTPAGREMFQEGHKSARHQAVEIAMRADEEKWNLLDILDDLYRETVTGNPHPGTILRIEAVLREAGLL